jgi:hypothetical protein
LHAVEYKRVARIAPIVAKYSEGLMRYGLCRKVRRDKGNKNTKVRAKVKKEEKVLPNNPGEKPCDTTAPPF